MSDTPCDIILRVERTLRTAELGLESIESTDAATRVSGLHNVIVFGRAVTNVLQNLRSVVPDFDAWYGPKVEQMRADPLMAFFYKARSEILKEGKFRTSAGFYIKHWDTSNLNAVPRPPGAVSFFMGDSTGGSGWIVETSPGVQEKFYVRLSEIPGFQGGATVFVADAPGALRGVPAPALAARYIAYLRALVAEAKEQFT